MSQQTTPAALDDTRVLDLTGEIGQYCTKLLADLGADVIKIEPPGGDPVRALPPFYHDETDPQKSLYWLNLNTSKRSVTLDIEKPEGRELFERLVATADIVVETADPGYMDGLGLGYEGLSKIKPDVILTSITGFVQTGPHAHLVDMAHHLHLLRNLHGLLCKRRQEPEVEVVDELLVRLLRQVLGHPFLGHPITEVAPGRSTR